jgi:hypothetical protein
MEYLMEEKKDAGSTPKQDPEKGNELNPRLKEPASPGLYLSGMDEPGKPTKKNPGHTNPSHNTPGHVRQDMKDSKEDEPDK